ncbi:DUF418 domain-containing protein [Marinilabiliaceae bacterium JC017]|nr:DUF418 domain-containing protein [Marinilabiliaceae bacterium JC017]
MSQTTVNEFKPTVAKNRIIFLDVLRGFALMGILFANILSWSGMKFLPFHEIKAMGNVETDAMLYKLLKFFVDTKFYTLFSLLFGVGFYLQYSRNGEKSSFNGTYLSRLTILLIIGVCHALIWSGDILMLYALMGFALFALRKLPPKRMLTLAIVLFCLPLLLDVVYMYTFVPEMSLLPKIALKVYPDMVPDQVVAGFQSESYVSVFKTNLHNVIWRWYDFIPSGRPFKVLGLFLLGFYLYHVEFFTKFSKQNKYLVTLLLCGLTFTGLTLVIGGSVASFSRSWNDILYRAIHEVGQITLGLSYVCVLAKLVDRFPDFIFFRWLKNYGRQSMSSYLGHTLLGIIVFYPFIGWGFFGQLTLETVFEVAVLILSLQLLFCTVWFRFFSFGPVEWLWRCATYRTWFPLRNKK